MTNQDADAGGLADAELMGRLSSKLGHRDYYDLITMLMRDRDERFALEARLAAAEAESNYSAGVLAAMYTSLNVAPKDGRELLDAIKAIRAERDEAEARAAAAEAKAALADEFRMFLSGAARKSAWERGWIARYDALTPTHESEAT